MRRIGEHVRGVIGAFLFIGLSIQTALGLLWMLANFTGLQEFGESCRYVEMSKSFLCDEYTGILYPVLLMLARGIGSLLHAPYYTVLYTVQLLAALYAAHRFLWACRFVPSRREASAVRNASAGREAAAGPRPGGGKRDGARIFWDIWGSLCLVTVPMAMQCHLAVLPNSLACSFFLVMISFVAEASGRPETYAGTLLRMAPLWLVTTLLFPEYKLLAAVPMAGFFVYSACRLWRRDAGRVARHALLLLVLAGLTAALGSLTQVPGSQGRVHRSIGSVMVSRFVWPGFAENYQAFPERIRDIITMEEAGELGKAADSVANVFGPAVEKAVGRREADRLFREMAMTVWAGNSRRILREILLDAASYAASPAALAKQLEGGGYESYAGRNYEIMRRRTPGLTRTYVRFCVWWFPIGTAAAGLSIITVWAEACAAGVQSARRRSARPPAKSGEARRGGHACIVLCMLSAFFMAAYYTLRGAGMMDYKNTVFVTLLWYILMLLGIRRSGVPKRRLRESEDGNSAEEG